MSPSSSNKTSLTATSFALYNVPKLLNNGTNWLTYQEQVMIAIGSCGLKWYLKGHVKQPNGIMVINIGTEAAPNMVHFIDDTTIATEDKIEEAKKKLDEY